MQQTSIKKKPWWVSFQDLVRNIWRTMKMVHRKDPAFFYGGTSLSVVMVVIPFLVSYLSAQFINLITEGGFSSIWNITLLTIAALYIILPFVNEELKNLYNYLYRQFRIRFEQYIQTTMLETRSRIDIQTHEDSSFSNFARVVDENDFRLLNFLHQALGLIGILTGASVAFTILAVNNPILAVFLLLALIPQFFVQIKFGRQTWGIWGAKAELRRKYSELLRPFYSLSGLIEMRAYAAKSYFVGAIHTVLSIFNKEIQGVERKRFFSQVVAESVFLVVAGIFTFVLMRDAVSGVLAVGTFLFLLGRISDVQYQVSSLIFSVADMGTDSLFVSDVYRFFDTKQALVDGSTVLKMAAPRIEFNNVSFAYPYSETLVLRDVSFSIDPGEKIAIVGINGAGKTTLTKLLMRFYDPIQGSITANGEPLMSITSASWLAQIAYLPQDYEKYHLPVKEAIALGNSNIPLDSGRVRESARKAGADEFIAKWPRGYDTPLGKEFDGEEPSVGQWQKLALARMFYKRANILILDEPTSSIDAIAELAIFNELEQLPDDTSVILISHRFNTVKNADKIIVIENGTIAEMGTHDELMQKKGHYHTLFTSQKDSYGTEA